MTPAVFKAFVKHASGNQDTPNDYVATKVAVMKMFPKLAGDLAKGIGIMGGAGAIGGALGADDGKRFKGAIKGALGAAIGIPAIAMAHGALMKHASFIHPAADLAGLGMLGVPVAKTLRDPDASAKERSHAKWEAAGLGTLGAVSSHNLWQAVRKPVASAATHI
jgi:hypothetical protein